MKLQTITLEHTMQQSCTSIDDLWVYPTKNLIARAKFVAPFSMRDMKFNELSREDLINLIRDWELERLKLNDWQKTTSRKLVGGFK